MATNPQTRSKASRFVTGGIIGLILVFAGLIGFSYMAKQNAASGNRSPSPGTGQPPVQGRGGPEQRQTGNIAPGNTPGARNAIAVRVQDVRLGTIETKVVINGDVIPRTQVAIYPTVAGKLIEARLQVGDTVRQGDIVAMVDPSRPGEIYAQNPVLSPISGTILQAPVSPGDTLTSQTVVYLVGELSRLLVETFVPERFSNVARKGLSAVVSLEALAGETFDAVVDEVSPVLDPASRTLKIRLRFTKQDPRIRSGMFAQVNLITQTRKDVPVIPREAVINTYGSWIAFVVTDEQRAERRELRLGLESEEAMEVLSGLEPGEQVVTGGQNFLSDADLVRVVP
ncbi:MAG: efflux RND transporter periplasmic adaptor subunit [Treponema sp.]|jgi:multidrug efflux pump subunit AcrA (membrane-fusion protein)|nr:efflux RND transporter periplasmic adaptor subunit [Treponema sp.]